MAEVGAKDVNLLSYWMPFLRNLREFKEIAIAEEPELRYILEARERALRNFFIEDADEWGISRFEDMMGITPNAGDSLEIRRFRVFFKWADYRPYTEKLLCKRLREICGSDEAFELDRRYTEYWLGIITHVSGTGMYELISDLLTEMLPCNLVFEYQNILDALICNTLYVGEICCTDDITAKADIETSIVGGIASSVGYWHKITHDVDFISASNNDVYSGMSTGVVYAKIITDDITSEISIENNSYVADPSVSSGITITINE